MTIYVSLFICLLGLVMYLFFSSKTRAEKAADIGSVMFWVGLFVFLFHYGGGTITPIR